MFPADPLAFARAEVRGSVLSPFKDTPGPRLTLRTILPPRAKLTFPQSLPLWCDAPWGNGTPGALGLADSPAMTTSEDSTPTTLNRPRC